MNLKNQPTVFMPPALMYDVERAWKMSKAAWMDVAWDLMEQACMNSHPDVILRELKERAELIQMHRKQAR